MLYLASVFSHHVRHPWGSLPAGSLPPGLQCVPHLLNDAGPSLAYTGRLGYLAGGIPNQPANMVRWLQDPPALKPDTAMPSLGVSEEEARHMAAYLYTLR